jgi:hypothetical protein
MAGHVGWLLVFAPFAYLFAVPGIPVYFLCRKYGWLKLWQVVGISALLGMIVSPLLRPGVPTRSDVGTFAAFGALTGLVFWLVAFAGDKSPRADAGSHEA